MVDVEEMFDDHFEVDVVLLHVFIDLLSVIDHEGSEGHVDLDGCDFTCCAVCSMLSTF